MKKRIVALFLAVLMVCTLMPASAFADVSGWCGDDVMWSLDSDGVLTISGSGDIDDDTWYDYSDSIKKVVIKSGVTSIGGGAFSSCVNLESVTIPESVTSIGRRAFSDCDSLTSITIPSGVTSIEDSTFFNCDKLKSVTLPKSVTSIGDYAFYYCKNLTSITIPLGVSNIGYDVFYGCNSLTSIKVDSNNKTYSSDSNGVVLNKSKTKLLIYPFGRSGSYTIPSSVTSVGDWAFSSCVNLESVTIPESVTSIGRRAFSDCDSLTSVTIPSSVESIGSSAFSNCENLTSVTISDGVKSIGGSAFYGCSSLKSVTIPKSVTSIGNNAFCYCNSLTSIKIPSGVTGIAGSMFAGCSSLTSVTIPSSVKSIGWCAFSWCSSLTSVTIPNSVTDIQYDAFLGCKSLAKLTLPTSVKSIGNNAFKDCGKLKDVYYAGSKTQYAKITGNEQLAGATIHYATADMAISAATATVYVGGTKTLSVKNKPSKAKVTWSSSKKSVAKVSSSGKITALKAGTATITASVKNGSKTTKLTCKVTVKTPTLSLNKSSLSITLGKTSTLTATTAPSGKTVTWSSSDKSIATVSSKGVVTGKKAGTATITASFKYGDKTYKKTCKVTVTSPYVSLSNSTLSVREGKTEALTAKSVPSGQTVTWSSSDKSIATVSSKGVVTGKKAGSATITASFKYKDKTYKKTCKVTVIKKYTITYKNLSDDTVNSNYKTYYADSAAITLKNASRDGYRFLGWYTDSKCTKKITKIAKGTNKNLTLYAKWEKVTVLHPLKSNLSNTTYNMLLKGSYSAVKYNNAWYYRFSYNDTVRYIPVDDFAATAANDFTSLNSTLSSVQNGAKVCTKNLTYKSTTVKKSTVAAGEISRATKTTIITYMAQNEVFSQNVDNDFLRLQCRVVSEPLAFEYSDRVQLLGTNYVQRADVSGDKDLESFYKAALKRRTNPKTVEMVPVFCTELTDFGTSKTFLSTYRMDGTGTVVTGNDIGALLDLGMSSANLVKKPGLKSFKSFYDDVVDITKGDAQSYTYGCKEMILTRDKYCVSCEAASPISLTAKEDVFLAVITLGHQKPSAKSNSAPRFDISFSMQENK